MVVSSNLSLGGITKSINIKEFDPCMMTLVKNTCFANGPFEEIHLNIFDKSSVRILVCLHGMS